MTLTFVSSVRWDNVKEIGNYYIIMGYIEVFIGKERNWKLPYYNGAYRSLYRDNGKNGSNLNRSDKEAPGYSLCAATLWFAGYAVGPRLGRVTKGISTLRPNNQ